MTHSDNNNLVYEFVLERTQIEVEPSDISNEETYQNTEKNTNLDQSRQCSPRSYNLVRDKLKRTTKLLLRYRQVDHTAYAFAVAQEVIDLEPRFYKETMNSKEPHK